MPNTTISAAELPARGQPLAGGIFVQRYWVGDQERALVLLNDELEGPWGEYRQEVETGWADGLVNTKAMAEAGSEIAKKALELGAHIPSPVEGHLLMAAKQEGLVVLREDRFHWLSAQCSAYSAYRMGFEGGWQDLYDKSYERPVRPVRSLIIQQFNYSFICG